MAEPADDLPALVVTARRGDRKAFGELYRRFARAVHATVLARTSYRDAPDLVQDVFATALARLPSLAEPAAFPGWLLAIARNRAVDHMRAKRPGADPGDDGDELAGLPGADPGGARNSELARVLAALRALPEAYRDTMIMRLVEGMTGPEIAAQTGLSPGSVRVNLHRGMKLVRERLGIDAEDPNSSGPEGVADAG